VCQAISKITVVGQQDQAFTIGVKPSDRKDAHIVRNELRHGRTLMCIGCCGNNPNRFVQHQIPVWFRRRRRLDHLSVDRNHIDIRVGAGAQFPHNSPIHCHPALQD
jgi:hypothetical protein